MTENNNNFNVLLFICFILIIALYDMYTQKEDAKELLYKAQDTIILQERAIESQKAYISMLSQYIYNP